MLALFNELVEKLRVAVLVDSSAVLMPNKVNCVISEAASKLPNYYSLVLTVAFIWSLMLYDILSKDFEWPSGVTRVLKTLLIRFMRLNFSEFLRI
jgi:hypothetical protein